MLCEIPIAWVHHVVMVRPGSGTSSCGSFDTRTEHRFITTKKILKASITMKTMGTNFFCKWTFDSTPIGSILLKPDRLCLLEGPKVAAWIYNGKIYLRRNDGIKWPYDMRRIGTNSTMKVLRSIRTFTQNLIPRSLHVAPRTSLAPIVEVAIRWSKQSTLSSIAVRHKSLC